MPRLLTLFFDIGSMADPPAPPEHTGRSANAAHVSRSRGGGGGGGGGGAAETPLQLLRARATQLVADAVRGVPAYMWYTCLPQLLSRVGHPNAEVQAVVVQALAHLLASHPHQALWHVSGLQLSLNKARKAVGERVVAKAYQTLLQEARAADAQCVRDAKALFDDLIDLAQHQPPTERTRETTFNIGRRIRLERFVVPVQAALTGQPLVSAHNPFPTAQVHIRRFNDQIRFMPSKAKPKKVSIQVLETGETLNFLCKQERKGDLRKDGRLMEVNGMVNRLLQRCPAGRQRRLRLRTYAVLCLNEECGVLEWVPNTTGFRQVRTSRARGPPMEPAFRYSAGHPKQPSYQQLRTVLDQLQHPSVAPHEAAATYRAQIVPRFPPCMHRWFMEHFREPTAWFEARTTFARSAAVWSGVGHVVGLGDRHGENILIDTTRGECVHVDFDCLFDKGLTLARPEIVPFRLTPNMVDGMGLTGYEGVYRNSLEVTMSVLRDNRETLLSVLEPFLQDPTVAWGRTGRAQRDEFAGGAGAGGAAAAAGGDTVNEDAKRILRVIDERLRGMYNVYAPAPRVKAPASGARGGAAAAAAAAADQQQQLKLKGPELPLSVQGQVHRLIQEATSLENLAQMYVGWMPWS
ncbi:kinase-like domain-containing protein [Tribonema minus]|uniref:non-specific serine/threonine protein kinase n=1 Tax=Tribonema minus TaxID=303371 RepID=A0A835Z967_9STRA|nr:kinase-like domain-containing protein [Tribonema minus]